MNDKLYHSIPRAIIRLYAEEEKTKNKLYKAIGDSHDVLARAKTVFPLTLFPDSISIDRTKLTVTQRNFMKAAEILSIGIEDILSVAVTVGPFFGSLKITTRFFDASKPYTIDHLWRADALRLKRILQGYIIARQKEVDCSTLSTHDLTKLLDDLGRVAPEEKV